MHRHDGGNQLLRHIVRTKHQWERASRNRVECLFEVNEDDNQVRLAGARLLDDTPESEDLRDCAAIWPKPVLLVPQEGIQHGLQPL